MAISKRKERGRGNRKPKMREEWVNSCDLSANQVSNAVGKVIDIKNYNELKFYLVRTLYSDPSYIVFNEALRIKRK